jgi:DNA replication initiation complex subunit (GINS family)
MITYSEIYEIVRKEKYSEPLQPLPKKLIQEFSEYIEDKTKTTQSDNNPFSDSSAKSKKQLENAISLFKELILRRKKKILSLVLVATETGIMKRDYENMLDLEKQTFDQMISAFESQDKDVSKLLNGKKETISEKNKLILFKENVEQFVDHEGNPVGPYKLGELVNINKDIAQILVQGNKATFIDED